MKLVIAYIQPEKLADVKQALFDVDITKKSPFPMVPVEW